VAPRQPFTGEHGPTPSTVRGISSGAQLPRPYLVFSGLDELLQNRWNLTEATARSTVAQLTVHTLRTGSNSKARELDLAQWLQLAGLALLVGTVAAEVIR
jgi:hypothetical protein